MWFEIKFIQIIFVLITISLFAICFNIEFTKLENSVIIEKSNIDKINELLVDKEDPIVNQMRQLLTNFDLLNSMASENIDTYLSHPIDVYLLMRRLAIDWKEVIKLIDKNTKLFGDFQIKPLISVKEFNGNEKNIFHTIINKIIFNFRCNLWDQRTGRHL